MKKLIAILLVLFIAVGIAFAALSTKYQKYLDILKTGEYTIKGSYYGIDENGKKAATSSPMIIAGHEGNLFIQSEEGGAVLKILVKNEIIHMIDDEGKTVITMAGESDDPGSEYNILPMENPYVTSSGNGKLDGKSLYYEKFPDENYDENTLWFNGNTLYALQTPTSYLYFDSFSDKADASLFVIPEGYEVLDLMSLFSSMLTEDEDTTSAAASSDDEIDWEALLGDIDWSALFSDDSDWGSDWDDDEDWGWGYECRYYEFGILMGLNQEQAQAFNQAMVAMDCISWSFLEEYYSEDTGKYSLDTSKLGDILWMDDSDIGAINNLINKFKK